MEFRFADPIWLWLLCALPVLPLWHWAVARRRRATLRYSDVSLFEGLSTAPGRILSLLPPGLRLGTLALLALAMARPQSGDVRRDVLIEGVDIMLVLDCSGSMRTADFRPNRLEAAKAVIGQFVEGRETDRIGLVVFGGASFTVCPLTVDYDALTALLERVHSGVVPTNRTAIGTGLFIALRRLRDSDAESKVIILLTDGENNIGLDPLTAAQLARGLGIKVYAIGVGTPATLWSDGGFDEALLQRIAAVTKGQYFHATDRSSLEAIYQQIDEMEKTEVEYNVYAQWDELMWWFLWPALGLLLLEILLRKTRVMVLP